VEVLIRRIAFKICVQYDASNVKDKGILLATTPTKEKLKKLLDHHNNNKEEEEVIVLKKSEGCMLC